MSGVVTRKVFVDAMVTQAQIAGLCSTPEQQKVLVKELEAEFKWVWHGADVAWGGCGMGQLTTHISGMGLHGWCTYDFRAFILSCPCYFLVMKPVEQSLWTLPLCLS